MSHPTLGGTYTYNGNDPDYTFLRGYRVRIVAAIFPSLDEYDDDPIRLTDPDEIARRGGIRPDTRVEVQPWLKNQNRYSFVTSDLMAGALT